MEELKELFESAAFANGLMLFTIVIGAVWTVYVFFLQNWTKKTLLKPLSFGAIRIARMPHRPRAHLVGASRFR